MRDRTEIGSSEFEKKDTEIVLAKSDLKEVLDSATENVLTRIEDCIVSHEIPPSFFDRRTHWRCNSGCNRDDNQLLLKCKKIPDDRSGCHSRCDYGALYAEDDIQAAKQNGVANGTDYEIRVKCFQQGSTNM